MTMEQFSNVWCDSPHSGTTLLVHLAIADSVNATCGAEVHLEYLMLRARASLEDVEASLRILETSEDIKILTRCPPSYPNVYASLLIVIPSLEPISKPQVSKTNQSPSRQSPRTMNRDGVVYLIRCGAYFKIGKSRNFPLRKIHLSLQMPHKAEVLHSIQTTEPDSLERWFHEHFEDKRLNGEWFDLSTEDIEFFCQR